MSGRAKWSMAQRFWAHVDIRGPDECWPWKGCEASTYPYFRAGTKTYHASRIAFMLTTGRWADYVRHSCDYSPCVNGAHLIESTHAENMADMVAKVRHRPHARTGRKRTDPW
jgi:hypothetical protein